MDKRVADILISHKSERTAYWRSIQDAGMVEWCEDNPPEYWLDYESVQDKIEDAGLEVPDCD